MLYCVAVGTQYIALRYFKFDSFQTQSCTYHDRNLIEFLFGITMMELQSDRMLVVSTPQALFVTLVFRHPQAIPFNRLLFLFRILGLMGAVILLVCCFSAHPL